MNVILDQGRYHSVTIENDFPHIDLMLTTKQALALLQALEAKRATIQDMALNYYDCRDCGQTHPYSYTYSKERVKVCPFNQSDDDL